MRVINHGIIRHRGRRGDNVSTHPSGTARLNGLWTVSYTHLSAECKAYAARKRLEKAPNYFKLWMASEDDNEVMAKMCIRDRNIMHLHSPESAILSAVIFNAIIIPILIPLALRGVQYKPIGCLLYTSRCV